MAALTSDGLRGVFVEAADGMILLRGSHGAMSAPQTSNPLSTSSPLMSVPRPSAPRSSTPVVSIAEASTPATFVPQVSSVATSTGQAPDSLMSVPSAPPPVEVLSARREELWTFGPDSSVIRRDLVNGTQQVLPLSRVFDQVLVATYSPSEDRIYVLDETTTSRGSRVARLIRLDPNSSAFAIVHQWPRVNDTSRFVLTAAPDGTLWIAASDSKSHVVAWIEPLESEIRTIGFIRGAGALLAGAARASRMGLSMVVEGNQGPEVIGYRAEVLRQMELRGGADACF